MNGLDFSTFASQGATEDVSDLDDQPSSESESEGEMIIEGKKKDKKEVEEIVKKEKKENEVKKAREGETLAGLVEGATEGAKAGKVKKGDYVSSLARTLRFALGCSQGAELVYALYSFCRGLQVFPPIPQWYMQDIPALPPTDKLPALTPALLTSLSAKSANLLAALPQTQPAPSSSAADKSFLSKILRSGTHSDKLSALILLVQADPIRNVGGLEGLRGMMGWKKDENGGGTVGRMGGREERVGVVRGVVDWFVGGGAPDRKLKCVCPPSHAVR